MKWLGEYAIACAIATSALVLTFIGGCVAGNWAGPGANTAAAQNYAHGLQTEWEADTQAKLGEAQRACTATTNALQDQLATLGRDRQHDAQAYSERILGLQMQLRAHGPREIVVQP